MLPPHLLCGIAIGVRFEVAANTITGWHEGLSEEYGMQSPEDAQRVNRTWPRGELNRVPVSYELH